MMLLILAGVRPLARLRAIALLSLRAERDLRVIGCAVSCLLDVQGAGSDALQVRC